jgi:hypothetical protein
VSPRRRHVTADGRRLVDSTSPGTEDSTDDDDDVEGGDGDEPTRPTTKATKSKMMATASEEDDGDDGTDDATTADILVANHSREYSPRGGKDDENENELCVPVEECELCHRSWRVNIEKEDERISGEYESCMSYGRRRRFECTVLSQGESVAWEGAWMDIEFRPDGIGNVYIYFI